MKVQKKREFHFLVNGDRGRKTSNCFMEASKKRIKTC